VLYRQGYSVVFHDYFAAARGHRDQDAENAWQAECLPHQLGFA